MNVHYTSSKNQVQNPIFTPHGEVVYELIGCQSEHGGVKGHSLAHIVIPPGKSSLVHYHQLSEETYYILQGSARMILDGHEFDLSPGQVCLILPKQSHQIFNSTTVDLEFLAICAPAWHSEDSYYDV